MLKKGNSNESFLDLDLEGTRTRDPDSPNVEAPHEVIGDFLTSLARVVNHRRRNA